MPGVFRLPPFLRRHGVAALVCLGAALIVLVAHAWTSWLDTAERSARNLLVRAGRALPPDDRLVFLALDSDSTTLGPIDLEKLYADVPRGSADFRALSLMTSGFPWPREVHGLLLDKLVEAGATVVAFDLLFPNSGGGDRSFAGALERHQDKVVLAANFAPQEEDGREVWSLQIPTENLVPQTRPLDPRTGFVNFFPDPLDGVVRAAQYRLWDGQLALAPRRPQDETFFSFAARAAMRLDPNARTPEGFTPKLLRFSGEPGTFRPRSLFQVFVPRYWEQNFGGGAAFRGKVVIVGPFGSQFHDEHDTPFARKMPGPELHLHAVNALLHGAFLRETSPAFERWAVVLVAAAVWGLHCFLRRPVLRFGLALLLAAAWAGAALLAYNFADLYLCTAAPGGTLVLCALGVFVADFAAEQLERARTRRTLERYMSADVVRFILDNPGGFQDSLQGRRLPVTVLFSDLRGFTTLTESYPDSRALVEQLNEYLSVMVDCVFRHGGSLDKFIGDAVMAVWGNTPTPLTPREQAVESVHCALDMLRELTALNARWKAEGRPALACGIGINHGEAIVGDMGSARRKEFTVIGDTVNTASRLEGLTKAYHLQLVLGEALAALVQEKFTLQAVDAVQVKGRVHGLEIFTVLGPPGTESPGLDEYHAALACWRGRDAAGTVDHLHRAATLRPNDWLVTGLWLPRAEERLADPISPWTNVTVMKEK